MAVLQALTFPDAEWSAQACGGVLGLFNGKERPWKYVPESQDIRSFGLIRPEEDITLTAEAQSDSPGYLTGGSYVVTVVEADSEGNQGQGQTSGPPRGSEGQSITIIEGEGIRVTFPAAPTNADATHYWVYSTIADGIWPTLGRVAAVAVSEASYLITGTTETEFGAEASDPDFTNFPMDPNAKEPPIKTYPMKMGRRLLLWGSEPLETTLQFTIGSTEAFYVSGDEFDEGIIGSVIYPTDENRGYLVTDFNSGSPYSVTIQDEFIGAGASGDPSNIECKICRPSGELAWSEPSDYQNFPAANVRYIELSGADPETGCAVVNGRGLIFTIKKTFGLSFTTTPALGWGQVADLSTQQGCLSHRTIQDVGGMVLWLSEGGISASMGGAPRVISDEISEEFEDVIKEQTGRCRDAFGIHWAAKQRYICFVPKLGDTVGCSKAIVVDYKTLPGEPKFRFSIYDFTKEFTCATIERHEVTTGSDVSYDEFPVLGDKDGYVWSFGIGESDGPTTGTLSGVIDSATSSPETLVDDDAAFDTSGLGLNGMMLTVRRDSDGSEQSVVLETNGTDTLYPDEDWKGWVPSAGDTYRIGGIEAFYETGWSSLGGDFGIKKLHRLITNFRTESSGTLDLGIYEDFGSSASDISDEGSTAALIAPDGRSSRRLSGKRCHYAKFRWGNKAPAAPFLLKAATVVFEGPDEPR